MGRSRLAKALVRELEKRALACEKRKKEITRHFQKLKQKYARDEISYTEFIKIVSRRSNGKNIIEWIEHYGHQIEDCKKRIIKEKKKIFRNSFITGFISAIVFLGLIAMIFYVGPTFLGFVIQEQEFTQTLNFETSESTTYEWLIENSGTLTSAKLSGFIEGEGYVKVYLDDLLILDIPEIESGSILTGQVVSNEQEGISGLLKKFFGFFGIAGKAVEEPESSSDSSSESPESSTSDSSSTESSTSESYSETSEEASQEDSTPSQVQDENLELPSDELGIEEPSTSETEIEEEIPLEEPEEIPEEIPEEPEETPEEKIIRQFNDICEETCDLEDLNLSKSSYVLRIEVSNAKLKLDEIKYFVITEELEEIPEEPEEIQEENITEIPETNITIIENVTEIPENITIIENITEENVTITTIQYGAILGQPVKWKKHVDLEKPGIVKIKLPKDAENITVNKIIKKQYSETSEEVPKEDSTPSLEPSSSEEEILKELEETLKIIQELEKQIENIEKKIKNETSEELESYSETSEEVPKEDSTPSPVQDENLELPSDELGNEPLISEAKKEKAKFSITGKAIDEDEEEKSMFGSVLDFFRNIFSRLTGRAIDIEEKEDVKEVTIDDDGTKYEIEYETPAPYAVEEKTAKGKKITISGPDKLNYTNILAYTQLPREVPQDAIKLYRTTDGIRELTEIINYTDSDNDGLIDYIEWIVPHLSNQTYELIIEIIKAEHLDSNRDFISDIYDEVKELDDIWSETINENDYVRVVFEVALDNTRDITLYPRTVSGTPRIEVYEIDREELIAEFSSLNDNQYNKVYLTNLISESQDTFDLRIVGGSVEIEHIIDPPSYYDYNSGQGTIHFIYQQNGMSDPLASGECFGGTQVASYTGVQIDNAAYLEIPDYGANFNPCFRFNFTISESEDTINWMFLHINGKATYGGGEDANCYIYNFDTPAWEQYCDNMPTSDGNCNVNITLSLASYVGPNNQVVAACAGKNLDDVGDVSIDYVQLTVYSTPTDTTYPTFSGYTETPTDSPTYSPGATTYEFNTTIADTNGTAWIRFDNNNYTATNLTTDVYNVTFKSLSAGTYYYNWSAYGSGVGTKFNMSLTYDYTINQAIPEGNLTNTTALTRDWDGTPTAIGYEESNTGDDDVGYKIFRDDIDVETPDVEGSAGTYDYILNATAGTNYTFNASMDTFTLTINPLASEVNLTLDYNQSNISIPWGTTIDLNCTTIAGKGEASAYLAMYKDEVLINNGTSPIGNRTTFNPTGKNNISCFYQGPQNYTASSNEWWVEVNDTTSPNVTITTPLSQNYSTKTITFNITALDNVGLGNCSYTLNNGVFNYSLSNASDAPQDWLDTNSTMMQGWINANFSCNDTTGNQNNTESVRFFIDSIFPAPRIIIPANNTNSSDISLDVNFTYTEINPDSCWWSNDTGVNNYSLGPCILNVNVSNVTWNEGYRNVTIYINDTAGNENSTTVFFTIDTIFPDINITIPTNHTNSSVNTLDVNYTYTEENCDEVWYSNDTYSENISLGCGNNITEVTWSDAQHNVTIWINDTANNVNSSFVTFTIDTIFPDINITIPTNHTNSSVNTLDVEYVYVEPNCDEVWYSNDTYSENISLGCGENITEVTWSDAQHNVTIWINDTANNVNSSFVTFTIDTIFPDINITSPQNNSESADAELDVEYFYSEDNCDSVWYSNDTMTENITLASCGENITDVTWTKEQHNVTIWINDTANNVNSSSINFTILATVAPTITYVSNFTTAQTLILGPSNTNLTFNFSVNDVNGIADLDNESTSINISNSGTGRVNNTACAQLDASGNNANYTCNVTMWWWDTDGAWLINVSIKDSSNLWASNDTTTITINSLTGFVSGPGNLSFATLDPGSTNQTPSNWITLNNTGNQDINYNTFQINATNLTGETNSNLGLWAANFSVGNLTGAAKPECDSGNVTAQNMSASEYVTVSGAVLLAGNYTINNNETGQEVLFVCIRKVGLELSEQAYSTSNEGSWTIRILLVALTFRRRKKKKKLAKDDKLLDAMNLIVDKLKEEYSLDKEEVIKLVIEKLKSKYNVTRKEVLKIMRAREDLIIPVNIFSKRIGGLEVMSKFMKENLNMSYIEIAKELGRDERTIWTAYKKATEKQKEPIKVRGTKIFLPISIFENKKLTILESLVVSLRQRGMKYSEIAELINRDQRNIWTIYSRAIKKLDNN